MSFCRFSSDNFYCDVYAYEDAYGYYSLWVAGSRRMGPLMLCPLAEIVTSEEVDYAEAIKKYEAWSADFDSLPHLPIELPDAGESYQFDEPEALYEKMVELREEGFIVPQSALEAVLERIDDGGGW